MTSELRHKDDTPMRKYNSPKLQAIEMENKQTAVEWIIDQLRSLSHSLEAHLGTGDIRVTQGMIDDFEEQAKQMEKEQAERMYSEEDLRESFKSGGKMFWTDINQETQEPYYYDFNEWFEQFKKK